MRGELRDSLENLYPDSVIDVTPCRSISVDVARGGTAAVHVLLTGLEAGVVVKPSVRGNRGAVEDAQWFHLLAVPVEVNTGPVGFVEQPGEENPDVIRRAPFNTYDAMAPIAKTVKATGETMALRLHLPIATSARAGDRQYRIDIKAGGEQLSFDVTVTVHGVTIPPVGRDSFPYTNWFSYHIIATRHGLTPWSEAHWRMLARYANGMAKARQNMFWVLQSDVFTVENGVPVLNAKRLRRIVETFTDAGLYFIEGGHFGGRTTSEWTCPTFSVGLTKSIATSPQGNQDIACISRQLMAEIERNGWHERWLQHIADEPIPDNASSFRIFTGIVRKYMPGIPIVDATMDEGLDGSVDIWCPQAQQYQKHQAQLEAQRAAGDRIWFYTCCFPGGPWLNRLLDMELLRPALFGWAAAHYKLDGFLHWGYNHYRSDQDPFRQSVVGHEGNTQLPAGDTHIVYPGSDGPWSSLRQEAQREGLEDYELLRILAKRQPDVAEAIIATAFRRFDDYTKDVTVFRAARKALLMAVSTTKTKVQV